MQYYLPANTTASDPLVYYPQVVGAADVVYSNKTYKVEERRQFLLGVEPGDGPVTLDWNQAERLGIEMQDMEKKARPGASFAQVPAAGRNAKNYKDWESDYKKWLRNEQALTLFKNKTFKAVSRAGESEADFRIRLQQLAKEERDLEVGKLRARYEKSAARLQDKLRDAEQDIAEEKAQASQKKIESAISIGGALLGAFLGRKKFSSSTMSKIGTAARRTGSAAKEARDVREAQAEAAQHRDDIDTLAKEFEAEVSQLSAQFDAQQETLEEVVVRAKSSDINVLLVGLVWLPYQQSPDGRTLPAFA